MKRIWPISIGMAAGLLLAACGLFQPPPAPPPPDRAFVALGLRSVAVGPINWATYQPGEMCSTFIDEDLRSALARELRRHGYAAQMVGNSVPRSFAPGTPPPAPGEPPPLEVVPSSAEEGVLRVWIEEYFENTLCGGEAPKYLTMGAVGVLYAGTPPREVWRGQARDEESGGYSAQEIMGLTTVRLTDRLLATLPMGPGWTEAR